MNDKGGMKARTYKEEQKNDKTSKKKVGFQSLIHEEIQCETFLWYLMQNPNLSITSLLHGKTYNTCFKCKARIGVKYIFSDYYSDRYLAVTSKNYDYRRILPC